MASIVINMNVSVTGQNSFKFDAVDLEAMETVRMKTILKENEVELLDVKFSMSDDSVENGLFIFGMEPSNFF